MIRAIEVLAADAGHADTITLGYDDRFRRRMAMTSDRGLAFLLDLPQAVELAEGQGLRLEDGRIIGVRAAAEPLMEVRADDPRLLMRSAWHVGNRHLPCAIDPGRLLLRWDHVIADMLEGLGCRVTRVDAPFQPEGGAYGGHGTLEAGHHHGHSHGHHPGRGHDPAHKHDHGHS